MSEVFREEIRNAYVFQGEHAILGVAMLDGKVVEGATVNLPLRTMNRHGLIAGATGTGKSKSLQRIAEILSDASVPVLMIDIKGDLSGLGAPGEMSDRLAERVKITGMEWTPAAYPVEFLSLSHEKGTRLRATVSEFGPVLISKILGLNVTQQGLMAVLFQACDENGWDLLDLEDLKAAFQYITNEGKKEFEAKYGLVSTSTAGTILRKVIELEQQGASSFFGETSFDVYDLMRIGDDGRGMISILRVTDLQDRPKLFSTFMLQLLAELYATLPEEGDLDKPRLCLFIEEAHLVFNEASRVLLEQIETIVKLIRSKGVGVFFITQNPQDIPAPVLAQLGLKIQHALRAFTAGDRKGIEQAAKNFPESEHYRVDRLLTELGIGEAFVTLLNEKGIPTPLAHVMMGAPQSRMGILRPEEIDGITARSRILRRYAEEIDRQSAREILSAKMEAARKVQEEAEQAKAEGKKEKKRTGLEDVLASPVTRQIARTAASMLTRSLLGAIFKGRR